MIVRGPFGIVKSLEHGSKKRNIGDPGSFLQSEKKKAGYYDTSLSKVSSIAASHKRYELSECGEITRYFGRQDSLTKQHELCRAMFTLHTLESYKNKTSDEEVTQRLIMYQLIP
jgi:hypothetical protein